MHQSRAITLLFIIDISPFAIPNYSSPMQFEENWSKLLKLESGKEALTDTQNGSEGTCITLYPATFFVAGYEDGVSHDVAQIYFTVGKIGRSLVNENSYLLSRKSSKLIQFSSPESLAGSCVHWGSTAVPVRKISNPFTTCHALTSDYNWAGARQT